MTDKQKKELYGGIVALFAAVITICEVMIVVLAG